MLIINKIFGNSYQKGIVILIQVRNVIGISCFQISALPFGRIEK